MINLNKNLPSEGALTSVVPKNESNTVLQFRQEVIYENEPATVVSPGHTKVVLLCKNGNTVPVDLFQGKIKLPIPEGRSVDLIKKCFPQKQA
jgi:hypothetical protein